jgi:hypothetical protein
VKFLAKAKLLVKFLAQGSPMVVVKVPVQATRARRVEERMSWLQWVLPRKSLAWLVDSRVIVDIVTTNDPSL